MEWVLGWINEKPFWENIYFKIFRNQPRHGVNCSCNCGNWKGL